MGYYKDQIIGTIEDFSSVASEFVVQVAPMLSELFCDESPDELLAIWSDCLDSVYDTMFADAFDGRYARQDMAFVDELFDELKMFVGISMENDW